MTAQLVASQQTARVSCRIPAEASRGWDATPSFVRHRWPKRGGQRARRIPRSRRSADGRRAQESAFGRRRAKGRRRRFRDEARMNREASVPSALVLLLSALLLLPAGASAERGGRDKTLP